MGKPTKALWWSLGVLAALIVIARLAAPSVIVGYINQRLDETEGYSGHVEDVDLSLWRGAYQIDGIRIRKTGSAAKLTLAIPQVDISVPWKAMFDGSIVAEFDVREPKLNFIATPKKRDAARAEGVFSLQDVPLQINRIGIHDGELHFRNHHSQPEVHVYAQNFDARVSNQPNGEELSRSLEATVHASALVMGSGQWSLDGKVEPFAKQPTFDVETELKHLKLTQINDFLRAYAKVDAEAGTISLYTEITAKNGKFEGYTKPFIDNLNVVEWQKEEENALGKMWEALVGATAEVFENQRQDTTATRIPLSGTLQSPNVNVWTTIGNLLRHAFIDALERSLKGSIGSKASAK